MSCTLYEASYPLSVLSEVMFRVVARIADVLEGRSHADDSEDVGFVPESAQDEPGLREGVVDNITIFQ